MVIWEFKVSSKGPAMKSLEDQLLHRPTRKIFELAHKVDPTHPLGLVGAAFAGYETKYFTPPKMSGPMMQAFARDVRHWVSEDGPEEVANTISVLFTHPKLGWVHDPLSAMLKKEFRYKYIVPIVHAETAKKQQVHGEQAEWRGQTEAGSVEVHFD